MNSTELDRLTRHLRDLEREPGQGLPDLAPIAFLLDHSGNPHEKIRTIHIAGTNGKGSTAWYLEALLRSRGLRTGLYTSPHLLTVRERIRVNGEMIPENALIRILTDLVHPVTENGDSASRPSYFDVMTAAAFTWFNEMQTDICVIETGLGGRLDSTNVIHPDYVLFTAISLDHMPLLGNDILSVAGEKFGIIKEGVPVFSLQQVEPVQSLLKEKCREFNSPLFMEGKDWHVENIHYDGEEPVFDYSGSSPDCVLTITLKSAFPVQSFNAGLALAVFENMVAPMDPQAVVKTLAKCRIPGRRERLADVPPVYFDAAHNPSALERVLEGLSPFTGEIVMILAFMMDKAVSEMMEILRGKDFPIRYLLADDPRTYIPSPGDGIENVYSSVDELVGECREDPENVLYFFTGTFRIYSMAQEFSRKIERA